MDRRSDNQLHPDGGGEVEHGLARFHESFKAFALGDATLKNKQIRIVFDQSEIGRIAGGKIVHHDNAIGLTKKPLDEVRPDKAGTPRHNDLRLPSQQLYYATVKILIGITGASGALYAQRLLDNLDPDCHEIHLVLTEYARPVVNEELPNGLSLPKGARQHGLKSMHVGFASGSNPLDAMVVIPCSMGTLGRIAHGTSENVLLRTADVMMKEKRTLLLVPRETPLSLVHVKNFELLLLAGPR